MRKLLVGTALAGLLFALPAKAETTECTNITSAQIPLTITVQGVYCLKQNVVTGITSGNAVEIQANNVTIDLNGWKIGGASAGTSTSAHGIYALNRKNIVIKNGAIRGFRRGIDLVQSAGTSSGHLIEDMILDGNIRYGANLEGSRMIVRNNRVVNMVNSLSTIIIGLRIAGDDVIISGNQVANLVKMTASGVVRGILLSNLENATVHDNVISRLIQPLADVWGLQLSGVSGGSVSNNVVMDVVSTVGAVGIGLSGHGITVRENRIVNPDNNGATGIGATPASTGIDCIENSVRGYTASITGCNYVSGNHTP